MLSAAVSLTGDTVLVSRPPATARGIHTNQGPTLALFLRLSSLYS